MPFPEIIEIVKTIGAPTTLAIIIIMRVEKRLDALTQAILSLPQSVSDQMDGRHTRKHEKHLRAYHDHDPKEEKEP